MAQTNMNWKEAVELVKLRIKEDGISWAVALKEYMYLTGDSLRESMDIGKSLQKYEEECRKQGEPK